MCSLGVPVSCVSEGNDGFSVLYNEEATETVGFVEVTDSWAVTSAVGEEITVVLWSTPVDSNVSVNNESLVKALDMSPEPSCVELVKNEGTSVDPVKGGTDSTITVSLEMSSVRVEDMTKAKSEDAVASDPG